MQNEKIQKLEIIRDAVADAIKVLNSVSAEVEYVLENGNYDASEEIACYENHIDSLHDLMAELDYQIEAAMEVE